MFYMFCPKCGTPFEENSKICRACGYEVDEEPEKEVEEASNTALSKDVQPEQPIQNSSPTASKSGISPLGIVYLVLAAIVLALSLYAAHNVVTGGMDIGSIESVGGQTLEEAYYQYLGTVYAGYAAFIRATGIFFASILAYIGLKK